jgi:hypothetical protein
LIAVVAALFLLAYEVDRRVFAGYSFGPAPSVDAPGCGTAQSEPAPAHSPKLFIALIRLSASSAATL